MAFGLAGYDQNDRGLNGLMNYTKKKSTTPIAPLIKQTQPANKSLASAPTSQLQPTQTQPAQLQPTQTQPAQRQPIQTQPTQTQPQREAITIPAGGEVNSKALDGLKAISKSIMPGSGAFGPDLPTPTTTYTDDDVGESVAPTEISMPQGNLAGGSTGLNDLLATNGGVPGFAGYFPELPEDPVDAYEKASQVEYSQKFITAEDAEALGLPDTYVGLPHSIGHTDPDTGEWIVDEDLLNRAKRMHDIYEMEKPEQIDVLNSDAYQRLVELNEQLASGELTEQDHAAAMRYLEDFYGYEPGTFSEHIGSMREEIALGREGQQGLSEDYQRSWDTQTQLELQKIREQSQELIEQLGYEGRNVKALKMITGLAAEQTDFRAARDAELDALMMAEQQLQFDSLEKRYYTLLEMGQMTVAQYTEALRQDRYASLEGLAQQITAQFEQNRSNREHYATISQAAINQVMMDIGVSESMMNQAAAWYEKHMAPYVAALEADAIREEKRAALKAEQQRDDANKIAVFGIFVELIGVIPSLFGLGALG